jgi:hypothetical protein
MISRIRFGASSPSASKTQSSSGNLGRKNTPVNHNAKKDGDRTRSIQASLKSCIYGKNSQLSSGGYALGDIPRHFSGRGHLEGCCAAKQEGLLETKKQKIHRRKKHKVKKQKRKQHQRDGGNSSGSEMDLSDSEEEEEEQKVWRPLGGDNLFGENPGDTKKGAAQANFLNVDADVQSLIKDELDWSKTSKYGKKSNENFSLWLDYVGSKTHTMQVESEDNIFNQLQ